MCQAHTAMVITTTEALERVDIEIATLWRSRLGPSIIYIEAQVSVYVFVLSIY